jgi:hypothetical protein
LSAPSKEITTKKTVKSFDFILRQIHKKWKALLIYSKKHLTSFKSEI